MASTGRVSTVRLLLASCFGGVAAVLMYRDPDVLNGDFVSYLRTMLRALILAVVAAVVVVVVSDVFQCVLPAVVLAARLSLS